MKTYTAIKRTINANGAENILTSFKSGKKADEQASKWFNELTAKGYVLTNITLGKLSKAGEDVYIYTL